MTSMRNARYTARNPWCLAAPRPAHSGVALGTALQHLVHQTVSHRVLGTHEVVAVGILRNAIEVSPGVMRQDCIQSLADQQDLLRVNLDVCRLPLKSTQRLVNHHPRVWQGVTLALLSAREQDSPHTRGLTDAHRCNVWTNELHGVVDCQPCRH